MAHHKDLTGADLHEPKGAATASAGMVYVADGAGSGAWTAQKSVRVALTRTITDVSTADTVYIAAPIDGTITRIDTILGAAISGADSNITFQINGVAIDSSAIVVAQSGSAAGDEDFSTPSGHNTVAPGDKIKIVTDGASTGTATLTVTILINATS